MAPPGHLYPALKQLREWLDNDVSQIMRPSRTAAPYAATLCILVGCEALSILLGRKPSDIFVQELILHHDNSYTAEMAKDIWQALRHGLAHIYDTKTLRIGLGGPEVELKVSWSELTHLQISDSSAGRKTLILHVPTMWADLERALWREMAIAEQASGVSVSASWTKSREWEVLDSTLGDWPRHLGVPSGTPFGPRQRRGRKPRQPAP